MKFTPFHLYSDNNYISLRDKRASTVGYVSNAIITILIINWIVIGYLTKNPTLIIFHLPIMLLVITGTLFIYKKKFPFGFSVLLITVYIYIMSAAILFEGMSHGIHNKAVYYIIPLLVITQYFAIYLSRKFILSFSLISIISLILYQLPITELPPLMALDNSAELDKISQLMVPIALASIILIFSLLAVDNVTSATSSYNNANDTLNMIMESMLPKDVANRLKNEGKTFADAIKDCTVLFVKVEISIENESISNENEINLLRQIFEDFEEETEQAGLEKIKTIGSSFMIASGIPRSRVDHSEAATRLALKLRAIASKYGIQLRIGINSGSAIAGVIGKTKFVYDLWGDTVNVASRLESHGVLGKIQISNTTAEQLDKKSFNLEQRGKIFLKGRGYITSYYVEDKTFDL